LAKNSVTYFMDSIVKYNCSTVGKCPWGMSGYNFWDWLYNSWRQWERTLRSGSFTLYFAVFGT